MHFKSYPKNNTLLDPILYHTPLRITYTYLLPYQPSPMNDTFHQRS